MNANCELLATNFAPAFEVAPDRAISRADKSSHLEKLKARLLSQALIQLAGIDPDGFIHRAANDAAALAWQTHFPLLVFPTLFEEKAHAALAQIRRQESVRRRSLKLRPFQAECKISPAATLAKPACSSEKLALPQQFKLPDPLSISAFKTVN